MQRPYYVLSHLVYNKLPTAQAVADQSRRTPPLGERLVGVNWASAQDEISKSLYGSYLDHLQNEYLGTTELSLPGSENFYDAAYHVLYSAAAAYQAEESPDGQDILDAFKSRVISTNPTAPVVNIGPLNIATTVTQVASAPGISLYATMGPPDFDRISGTRWTSMSAWCVQYNASAASYQFEADGLLYDWADHLYYDPESGPPACLADY
jgi:hypothetical protein